MICFFREGDESRKMKKVFIIVGFDLLGGVGVLFDVKVVRVLNSYVVFVVIFLIV